MERQRSRALRILLAVVLLLRIGNWLSLIGFVAMLVASLFPGGPLVAHLAAKYAGRADPVAAVHLLQAVLIVGMVGVFIVARLLRALQAVAASVGDGDPFHAANAVRLRAIGVTLLGLQLLDLAFGAITVPMRRLHLDMVDWQPSLTGWIAVLVAFVLARVFREGAAMRDDLDGTV